MFSQLTSIAKRRHGGCGKGRKTRTKNSAKNGRARVAKTTVPGLSVDGGKMSLDGGVRETEWVEGAIIIGAMNHGARPKVLHRKTVRVKFNGTIIVTGKLPDRNEIMNDVRGN